MGEVHYSKARFSKVSALLLAEETDDDSLQ